MRQDGPRGPVGDPGATPGRRNRSFSANCLRGDSLVGEEGARSEKRNPARQDVGQAQGRRRILTLSLAPSRPHPRVHAGHGEDGGPWRRASTAQRLTTTVRASRSSTRRRLDSILIHPSFSNSRRHPLTRCRLAPMLAATSDWVRTRPPGRWLLGRPQQQEPGHSLLQVQKDQFRCYAGDPAHHLRQALQEGQGEIGSLADQIDEDRSGQREHHARLGRLHRGRARARPTGRRPHRWSPPVPPYSR